MDRFKFSLGPFELFASIIAGIPSLAALLILLVDTELKTLNTQKTCSIQLLILFIAASYIIGSLISGITWPFYKILKNIFWKLDDSHSEKKYLIDFSQIDDNLSKRTFMQKELPYRISYLVKKHIGTRPIFEISDTLLSFLRVNGALTVEKAEYMKANEIMYRNLFFGFTFLGIVLLILGITSGFIPNKFLLLGILSIVLSFLSLYRTIVFRQWWSKEILLGFYYFQIENDENFSIQ